MAMRALVLAVCFATAGLCQAAEEALIASLNETVIKVATPTVRDARGNVYSGPITVTQFKPDGPGPFPLALILHGRSMEREVPARFRYTQAARYFVRRGFAVLVPTRLGYGASGINPDPEESGVCNNKVYAPGFEAAAQSTVDVINYARQQPFIDAKRIVVVGHSVGGATAIAVAARHPDGVLEAINFSGGNGGDARAHPRNPCSAERLEHLFAAYGVSSRLPTLWIYSENDQLMGATAPKRWFAAYGKTGGTGEFVQLPPFGDDGHSLFGKGFELWRPLTDQFLAKAGFALPKSAGAPAPTSYAALADVGKLPLTSAAARERYAHFLQLDVPRAYAIGPKDSFGFASAPDATERALAICRKNALAECKLYAVDDQVVWKE